MSDSRHASGMAQDACFIAVDWGTTNLRAWRLSASGDASVELTAPYGVSRIEVGAAPRTFYDKVRPALESGDESLPSLMCGMVGSTMGWADTPYVRCPATIDDILSSMRTVAHGVRIVPGLRCDGIAGGSDILRGEETHCIGWMAANPARRQGRWLLCHPGTHSKWIEIVDGAVTRFSTAMTGELFDIIKSRSVLRSEDDAFSETAFAEGLERAWADSSFVFSLFSARTRVVADGADPLSQHAYLSGLLIGAEIADALRFYDPGPDAVVHLVGAPTLTRHYAEALKGRAIDSSRMSGDDAAIAGFVQLAEKGAFHDA